MKTLKEACQPHHDIFDAQSLDPREDIEKLIEDTTSAEDFLKKTHITQSLQTILELTLQRLCGKSPTGVIKLKQAMGGGKTHSLLTAGILAKHPKEIPGVLAGCKWIPAASSKIVVISGHQDYDLGIWQAIAEGLGKPDHFREEARKLTAPGEKKWRDLLNGEQALIILDELPLYLDKTKGVQVGASNLASQTCHALTNLFACLSKPGTEKCMVLFADLNTEYAEASGEIQKLITQVTKEADRLCREIEPVDLGSNEVYQILRKRLFVQLPAEEEIVAIQKAYKESLDKGARAKLCTEDTDIQSRKILETYPFSPTFKDLFSRFRHNTGFRQTRGMIKLLAAITSDLWQEDGRAASDYLIGPEHLDIQNDAVGQEIATINDALRNAIATDISNRNQTATIEVETKKANNATWLQDAGRIIFFASLSKNENEQGLNKAELGTALAQPNRDLQELDGIIDTLSEACRYLHRGQNDRMRFRNVENIRTRVHQIANDTSDSRREAVIKTRLEDFFKAGDRHVYKSVKALPSLDEVKLVPEEITLLILQPRKAEEAQKTRNDLYQEQRYKNRVLILSGSKNGWSGLCEAAAKIEAAGLLIQNSDIPQGSLERKELEDIQKTYEKAFREKLISSFGEVYFPIFENNENKLQQQSIRLILEDGHKDSGEQQILTVLKDEGKFEESFSSNLDTTQGYCTLAETHLFSSRSTPWKEIVEKAAENTNWPWSGPNGLNDLKKEAIANGIWREDGERVEHGPFPQEKTSIEVTPHPNGNLRITPRPANAVVHYEVGESCTEKSKVLTVLDNYTPEGKTITFLAVDPTGAAPTGETTTWRGIPVLKRDISETGTITLESDDPDSEIWFTEDDSDPTNSPTIKKYEGPFKPKSDKNPIRAVARKGDIQSKPQFIHVGKKGEAYSHVDKAKPVVWKTTDRTLNRTGSTEINSLLGHIKTYDGTIQDFVDLTIKADDENNANLTLCGTTTPQQIVETINFLIKLLSQPEKPEAREAKISHVVFPNLDQLRNFADAAGAKLNPKDVSNV